MAWHTAATTSLTLTDLVPSSLLWEEEGAAHSLSCAGDPGQSPSSGPHRPDGCPGEAVAGQGVAAKGTTCTEGGCSAAGAELKTKNPWFWEEHVAEWRRLVSVFPGTLQAWASASCPGVTPAAGSAGLSTKGSLGEGAVERRVSPWNCCPAQPGSLRDSSGPSAPWEAGGLSMSLSSGASRSSHACGRAAVAGGAPGRPLSAAQSRRHSSAGPAQAWPVTAPLDGCFSPDLPPKTCPFLGDEPHNPLIFPCGSQIPGAFVPTWFLTCMITDLPSLTPTS